MKKPLTELIERDLETVEDVINGLMQVPKRYTLHPLGQKCKLGVDHYHECVYLEDPNCIDEYTSELIEEVREMGEPTEIEVPDEKLETYQSKLYVVMGYTDVNKNGNYEASIQGVFSTESLAKECGDELIEVGNVHHYEIEYSVLDEFGWK